MILQGISIFQSLRLLILVLIRNHLLCPYSRCIAHERNNTARITATIAEISILRDSSTEISSLGITNCVDVVVASVAVGGTTTSTPKRLAFC